MKQADPDSTTATLDLSGEIERIAWQDSPFGTMAEEHRPRRCNEGNQRGIVLFHLRFPPAGTPLSVLEGTLAPEEKKRLAPMAPARRVEFTALRALLRILLGKHMGLDPARVPIQIDASGKPVLPAARGPWFNLSHTRDQGLCAIDRCGPIGVDIELEQRETRTSMTAIATRILGADALVEIAGADESRRAAVFLRHWVRNEAAAKALGTGLRRGGAIDATLDVFDLNDIPGCAAAVARKRP